MEFFTEVNVYKIWVILVEVLYHKVLSCENSNILFFFFNAWTSENKEIFLRADVIVSQLVLPCDNAAILW